MTNKFLNIVIVIISIFIITFFAMRVVYWGMAVDKSDQDNPIETSSAIVYTIDK